ncbi:glycosyltransferase [Shewanella benthica]|uniref:glycosyltransferase n=1 Tax=Shewanella benthica TaxID=43661 RepID=UPI00187AF4A9|nr:glycosyltransferase [Shewanella benthica]MBE7214632.1 glycosyltransferase [Shewanella benthica]MCL1060556.1 glycosyltransferase [Shewanella benthica]
MSGLITRIFVVFTILFFFYFAQQQLENFRWEASYFTPVFIVMLIYLAINFIGACIWSLLLTGVDEPHQFSTATRIFFISQIGKYIPGNIVHLIGRVANAKSVGIRPSSVLYTLAFELILLILSAAIFASVTIFYADLNQFSGHTPDLVQLMTISLVCIAITALIIFFSPKLSVHLGLPGILNIPKMPSVRTLAFCLILFWVCFMLLGLSTNYLAGSIFNVEFNNILFVSGIFTISFVAGFLTPGAPAGIGVREFMLVLLLTPVYGELCAVGVAGFSRIAQMSGDLLTFLIGWLVLKHRNDTRKSSNSPQSNDKISIIYWGTYDLSKPRNPILHDSLEQAGCTVMTCHENIWAANNDKSQIKGLSSWLSIAWRHLLAYPRLVVKLFRLKKSNFIIVGYLGHLDIFVLWPFARIRGIPIVWDAFISLYNTVVEDRKMFGKRHPVSLVLYAWEWLACRLADAVLLDTNEHADYFRRRYHLEHNKVHYTFVGAEDHFFQSQPDTKSASNDDGPIEVLFYGTFIPLHGISTIIKACRLVPSEMANWTIIGKGQEESKIQAELDSDHISNLEWIKWVPYKELGRKIQEADVCLGIFGDTKKSAMVIPNKVFQIIAASRPVITRDSPAIVELLSHTDKGVWLVPPEDEEALAQAVKEVYLQRPELRSSGLYFDIKHRITPKAIGSQLLDSLYRAQVIR